MGKKSSSFLLGALFAVIAIAAGTLPAQPTGGKDPGAAPVPLAPADEAKYLKPYSRGEINIRAGFMPDQPEYFWGEPMHYFSLVVKNIGDQPVSLQEGGDYRGGRSENNKLTAVDDAGRPVPTPRMFDMGGLVGFRNLAPGAVYRVMLPVERRLTFTGPGVFAVTGTRTLRFGKNFDDPAMISVATSNTFILTILPATPETITAEVERLAARIRAHGSIEPRGNEYSEPNDFTMANLQDMDLATLAGIDHPAALEQLILMAGEGPLPLRAGALRHLGASTSTQAMQTITAALRDPEIPIRQAAADALGTMKTDSAADALKSALAQADPNVAETILRAMGRSHSPKVLADLVEALQAKEPGRRRAAADGLVAFGGDEAAKALAGCAGHPDLDFREYAVKQLSQGLRRPIEPQWLMPVIKSRRHANSIGEAPTLLRLACGRRAVPALIGCLDFDDPSIRGYYNWSLIYDQSWCEGGLKIPWVNDLNRDGTPAETERNRQALRALKAWVAEAERESANEPSPIQIRWPEELKEYGDPVDGHRVRLTAGARLWPAGMPQLLQFSVLQDPGNTVAVDHVPDPLEVQVNGQWYRREPPLTSPTPGLAEGHPADYRNILLDENWRSLDGNRPLRLVSGHYTVSVRLSLKPTSQRTGLAMSRPVTFKQM